VKPLTVLLIALVACARADAAPAPFDSFLASAWSDHKVTLRKKNQDDFGHSSSFKPIEGMQLRVSQNEVIEDRKIALRVLPRGFKQDRLLGSLSAGQNRIEALGVQAATTQALLERYLAAASYATAYETHRLWTKLSKLRSKRLSMLQIAARSSQATGSDLIKQRKDVEQSEVKGSLAEADLRAALVRMKALDPSFKEGSFDLSALPTPADMLKVVKETAVPDAAPESLLARENAARAHDELNYELAKDDRLIQFVEFSYSEDKVAKDNELGFRVAFNIPGFASTELNRSEKARELVKYEVEAREAQREQAIAQGEAKQTLAVSADLYKSLVSVGSRPSEKRMRRLVGRQDPLLAVTIEEEGLERQLRQQDVSAKAFEAYFNFLAASGVLASRSKTNFLSRDLREIR
jgi:hypothetical protein